MLYCLITSLPFSIFETGIKVVHLLAPYRRVGKIGLFGGAGVGKTVLIMELIPRRSFSSCRLFSSPIKGL